MLSSQQIDSNLHTNNWLIALPGPQSSQQQVCRSSLLFGRNVCWLRRMLPPGESRWVFAACSIKIRKRRDRRTDGRTPDRYTKLCARRGQRCNISRCAKLTRFSTTRTIR